jgi:hypothetical protein
MFLRCLREIARSRPAAAACVAVALLASSCGGDKQNPPKPGNPTGPAPPTSGPDPGVIQIRGGERLGWTHMASSADAIRAHSFRLFIDGAEAALSDTRCSTTAADGGYECSGRLPTMAPGQHSLELASIVSGQQSARSQALTVVMAASFEAAALESTVSAADLANSDESTPIASGLANVEWLSLSPDGAILLFVEGRRAVRAIEGDRLVDTPAFALGPPADAIVGMAIDPAFETTRAVYLAWTELQRDGSRALSLTRFRYVGATLGEGATIVTGLPVPEGASAPLAVDGEGLVYLALPSLDASRRAGREGAWNGFIVRFGPDGRVPDANRAASPILAVGFSRPSSIAVDHGNRRLWAAGMRSGEEHALVTLALEGGPGTVWPRQPDFVVTGAARPGFPIASVSFAPPGAPPAVNVVAAGVGRRAPLAADGTLGAFETIRFGAPGAVTGVAGSHDGRSYAAVKTTAGESAIYLTRD